MLYLILLSWSRTLALQCTGAVGGCVWVENVQVNLSKLLGGLTWTGGMAPKAGVISWDITSMGTGKMMVLLFSAEMLFRVCRYRIWEKNKMNNNGIVLRMIEPPGGQPASPR